MSSVGLIIWHVKWCTLSVKTRDTGSIIIVYILYAHSGTACRWADYVKGGKKTRMMVRINMGLILAGIQCMTFHMILTIMTRCMMGSSKHIGVAIDIVQHNSN